MHDRRFLPNLSLLRAFDAVMRHGSVSRAAEELGLSQSTVSRLVQSLEAQLATALFHREKKRLIALETARAYHPRIAEALALIQSASMGLVVNPGGGVLDLAVLPSFATRWLGPRLPGFLAAHPGISLNLTSRLGPVGFEAEQIHALIYYGQGDLPGARHQKIFAESLTACASPAFLARHPVAKLADLAGLPLLRLASRPGAWAAWAKGQGGLVPPGPAGMQMDQFAMMIQAAVSGLGVALLPDYLAQVEIAEARLVAVLEPGVAGDGAYYLAWPERHHALRPLVALRQWLQKIAV